MKNLIAITMLAIATTNSVAADEFPWLDKACMENVSVAERASILMVGNPQNVIPMMQYLVEDYGPAAPVIMDYATEMMVAVRSGRQLGEASFEIASRECVNLGETK